LFCLEDINLIIDPGEYMILLGSNGSGKTLLMDGISGRYPLNSGSIMVDRRAVESLMPERRKIGYIQQNSGLFSKMSVEQNISFGMRMRKRDQLLILHRVSEWMERLDLTHLRDRSVSSLSGGERQRVALARAMVLEPQLLLLDEPLSAVDPAGCKQLMEMLKSLQREKHISVLHVTHDLAVAEVLGQKIAVLAAGRMQTGVCYQELSKVYSGGGLLAPQAC
jgi:ABC-type Fe3+/spermidine/putrescine transport system ATPase subunit